MQTIAPENIAAVMALVPSPHSFAELDRMVRGGLPKSALKTGVGQVGRTMAERQSLLHAIVAEATYKRRKDRLTPDESEKAARLARVFATAEYVWNSPDDARAFLYTPHPLLGDATPLTVSMTELGARRVEELLWKLYYGLPA